jgi:hypothetical protein
LNNAIEEESMLKQRNRRRVDARTTQSKKSRCLNNAIEEESMLKQRNRRRVDAETTLSKKINLAEEGQYIRSEEEDNASMECFATGSLIDMTNHQSWSA